MTTKTKTRPFSELAAKAKADPVRRARIDRYGRVIDDALALAAARDQRRLTQRTVAEALGVSQANVSRIEHEEDLYLSTLRDYVRALGGSLEINAVFPDSVVSLVASEGEQRA